MNILETAKALGARFDTEIANPLSLPTQYDNMTLELDPSAGDDLIWCRFSIEWASNFQTTIGVPGNNRFRRLGNAVAQLFIRLDQGDSTILELADTIEAKFRSLTINSLVLKTPDTFRIGNTDDGYYQVNVVCPFQTHLLG